jgi:hypothetical protein
METIATIATTSTHDTPEVGRHAQCCRLGLLRHEQRAQSTEHRRASTVRQSRPRGCAAAPPPTVSSSGRNCIWPLLMSWNAIKRPSGNKRSATAHACRHDAPCDPTGHSTAVAALVHVRRTALQVAARCSDNGDVIHRTLRQHQRSQQLPPGNDSHDATATQTPRQPRTPLYVTIYILAHTVTARLRHPTPASRPFSVCRHARRTAAATGGDATSGDDASPLLFLK